MCLRNPKLITPSEDIVCYKILGTYENDINDLINIDSKVQTHYKLNKTKSLNRNTEDIIDSINDNTYIEGGAYHSYFDLEDAIYFAKRSIWINLYIVECIIPKNSKYIFEGTTGYMIHNKSTKTKFQKDCNCYASQKIKPIKIVAHVNNVGRSHTVEWL